MYIHTHTYIHAYIYMYNQPRLRLWGSLVEILVLRSVHGGPTLDSKDVSCPLLGELLR